MFVSPSYDLRKQKDIKKKLFLQWKEILELFEFELLQKEENIVIFKNDGKIFGKDNLVMPSW